MRLRPTRRRSTSKSTTSSDQQECPHRHRHPGRYRSCSRETWSGLWRASKKDRRLAAGRIWWAQDRKVARARNSLAYRDPNKTVIMHAIRDPAALLRLTKDRDTYITNRSRPAPDVGGAVLRLEEPKPLDTSGGLGAPWATGFPARHRGSRWRHRDSLVTRHPRRRFEATPSIQMCIKETVLRRCSTSCRVQDLHPEQPVHGHGDGNGCNCCHGKPSVAFLHRVHMPDFVKLRRGLWRQGIRCDKPADLDDALSSR